jgi:hypothetical protein
VIPLIICPGCKSKLLHYQTQSSYLITYCDCNMAFTQFIINNNVINCQFYLNKLFIDYIFSSSKNTIFIYVKNNLLEIQNFLIDFNNLSKLHNKINSYIFLL